MYKRLIVIIMMLSFIFVGCGKKSDETVMQETVETIEETGESIETTPEVTATIQSESTKEPENEEIKKEEAKKEEAKKEETEKSSEVQTSQPKETADSSESNKKTEATKATEPKITEISKQTEKPKQNETEKAPTNPPKEESPKIISYDPNKVVSLAMAKVKKGGKISIADDLDDMLAAGEISKKDYKRVYPTDGAGYFSVYVAANMAEARSIDGGTSFNSEEDVAKYIAGLVLDCPQEYFYIEYHGTENYGDKKCYVFYCYRA